jgi:hypothetical protein
MFLNAMSKRPRIPTFHDAIIPIMDNLIEDTDNLKYGLYAYLR